MPVLIHGGYWRALRAEDHRFVLPGLARIGCGVANIEYRLMPSVRMADVVTDVAAALRTIAAVFPGTALLPVGHSAGAHLAVASLHLDPGLQQRVSGVVAISGAFDLSLIARSFLQAELSLTPEEIGRFSIASLPNVPTLLITGTEETEPFQDQADALAMTAAHARRLRVAHCHHMSILHGCFSGQAALVPALRDWLSGQSTPNELEVPIP
jgi:arylformamidase